MAGVTKLDLTRQGSGQGVASQQTHIESSRAVAQVQGALVVAQQRPRDEMMARERMRAACGLSILAERAFFSFNRGGGNVNGPSIHLATELARCWGNVDYGIVELSRGEGQSEMQAYAWDLETNARNANSFIAPHVRDTKQGAKPLTETRDIYESNANLGARRLRECIFRVLPVSFREEAIELCRATIENGGGESVEVRREKLLKAFAALGVSRKRLERRAGRSADHLTVYDIANLRIVYGALQRGETTADAEFPDDAGGEAAEELRGRKAAPPAAEARQEPKPAEPERTTDAQAEADEIDDLLELRIPGQEDTRLLAPMAALEAFERQARGAPNQGYLERLFNENDGIVARLPAGLRAELGGKFQGDLLGGDPAKAREMRGNVRAG